jgi:hypothetical protein
LPYLTDAAVRGCVIRKNILRREIPIWVFRVVRITRIAHTIRGVATRAIHKDWLQYADVIAIGSTPHHKKTDCASVLLNVLGRRGTLKEHVIRDTLPE